VFLADIRYAVDWSNLLLANMVEANMRDSDLRGSNLAAADMEGSDLKGANLDDAKYTTGTKWPDGFDAQAAGAILVDDDGNPVEDANDGELGNVE